MGRFIVRHQKEILTGQSLMSTCGKQIWIRAIISCKCESMGGVYFIEAEVEGVQMG